MQEPYQDKVKLLPEELTDEEREQVVGGMSDGAFQAWKVDYLNNFLQQLYDNKREVERQGNPV